MTVMLKNIRVLELGRAVAAPWCGQMLGDFGAEVIKVETVEGGDFTRQLGPTYVPDANGQPTEDGSVFVGLNRNKKSLAIDFRQPDGQEIMRRLAAISDVFIENFKPGDLARRGLDYASLGPLCPRLVYLSVSGFGQTGPYRERPGLDNVAQGMIGLMNISGEADGPPGKTPVPIIDYFTGMNGCAAILAALYNRDVNGGKGQYIDVSLFDAGMSMMGFRYVEHILSGGVEPKRGEGSDGISPAGSFDTATGIFQMAIRSDVEFRRLCDVLGAPELPDDPRYNSPAARTRNREAVNGEIARLVAPLTLEDVLERLAAAAILNSPIHTFAQAISHPQTAAREMIGEVKHGRGAMIPLIRNPLKFSGTPVDTYVAAPLLGSSTDALLRDLLQMRDDEIATLRERRVIA